MYTQNTNNLLTQYQFWKVPAATRGTLFALNFNIRQMFGLEKNFGLEKAHVDSADVMDNGIYFFSLIVF